MSQVLFDQFETRLNNLLSNKDTSALLFIDNLIPLLNIYADEKLNDFELYQLFVNAPLSDPTNRLVRLGALVEQQLAISKDDDKREKYKSRVRRLKIAVITSCLHVLLSDKAGKELLSYPLPLEDLVNELNQAYQNKLLDDARLYHLLITHSDAKLCYLEKLMQAKAIDSRFVTQIFKCSLATLFRNYEPGDVYDDSSGALALVGLLDKAYKNRKLSSLAILTLVAQPVLVSGLEWFEQPDLLYSFGPDTERALNELLFSLRLNSVVEVERFCRIFNSAQRLYYQQAAHLIDALLLMTSKRPSESVALVDCFFMVLATLDKQVNTSVSESDKQSLECAVKAFSVAVCGLPNALARFKEKAASVSIFERRFWAVARNTMGIADYYLILLYQLAECDDLFIACDKPTKQAIVEGLIGYIDALEPQEQISAIEWILSPRKNPLQNLLLAKKQVSFWSTSLGQQKPYWEEKLASLKAENLAIDNMDEAEFDDEASSDDGDDENTGLLQGEHRRLA